METYVIRIYRREAGDAVTGVVENAALRRIAAFRSIAELSDALRRARKAGTRKRVVPASDAGDNFTPTTGNPAAARSISKQGVAE
jgi:hypothetical protein